VDKPQVELEKAWRHKDRARPRFLPRRGVTIGVRGARLRIVFNGIVITGLGIAAWTAGHAVPGLVLAGIGVAVLVVGVWVGRRFAEKNPDWREQEMRSDSRRRD
jgi:type IV secretory pathway TrbD component